MGKLKLPKKISIAEIGVDLQRWEEFINSTRTTKLPGMRGLHRENATCALLFFRGEVQRCNIFLIRFNIAEEEGWRVRLIRQHRQTKRWEKKIAELMDFHLAASAEMNQLEREKKEKVQAA